MQDVRRKNKHNDSDAIPRYEHVLQPAQPSPMKRTPSPTHLNYQQQQLWQHNSQTKNESPFKTSRISAFGPLVIPENSHFTDGINPTLSGDVDSRTSQDARNTRYRNQTAHRPLPIWQAPPISALQLLVIQEVYRHRVTAQRREVQWSPLPMFRPGVTRFSYLR